MARELHRSDLEEPTVHQALYARNLSVNSPSPSELWLIWHAKGLIKERTQRTCPVWTPPLRNVVMEAIVVGTEPLGSHVVIRETASFYRAGVL